MKIKFSLAIVRKFNDLIYLKQITWLIVGTVDKEMLVVPNVLLEIHNKQ